VTPVIVIYEVYKRLKRELSAATARKFHAELVTSDRDFERVIGVTYLPKKSRGK